MAHFRLPPSLGLFAAFAVAACSDSAEQTPSASIDLESPDLAPEAIRGVAAKLERFAFVNISGWSPKPLPGLPAGQRRVLEASSSAKPVVPLDGNNTFGLSNRAARTQVTLPRKASGSFAIRDTKSDLGVEVQLEGTSEVEGIAHRDLLAYPRALGGADLIHRVSERGTEDFALFEAPPASNALAYKVRLDDKTSLRLVANTLEFVDPSGTPRLRVSPPYLVDASGTWREARLEVIGCAVDTNPAAPWDQPTTQPGASECGVKVSWSDKGLSYPILVDPSWNATTENMGTARSNHQMVRLSNGRVLAVGGYGDSAYLSSAEVFDLPSKTWAATGSLATARAHFALHASSEINIVLPGGDSAYAIGGENFTSGTTAGPLNSVEKYSQSTGMWAPSAPMNKARSYAGSASFSTSGRGSLKIIMAGGTSGTFVVDNTAEVFNGTSWSYTATNMASPRERMAVGKVTGYVVFAGGYDGYHGLNIAERYSTSAGTWSSAGPMPEVRSSATATAFATDKLYVAGGINNNGYPSTTMIYDGATNAWTTEAAGLFSSREGHSAAPGAVGSGKVVIMGGERYQMSTQILALETEVRTPNVGFTLYCASGCGANTAQVTPRAYAAAVSLADNLILYAGGYTGDVTTTTSEIFDPN